MNGAENEVQAMNSRYHLPRDPYYMEKELEEDHEQDPKVEQEPDGEMESSEHQKVWPMHDEELVSSSLSLPYKLGLGILCTQEAAQKWIRICRGNRKKSTNWIPDIQRITADPNQYDPFHDRWVQNYPQNFRAVGF